MLMNGVRRLGRLGLSTLCLVMLSGTLAAQADSAAPVSTTSSVGGLVVSAGSGEPISGAIVVISGTDLREETGDDGRFLFEDVESGDVTIVVGASGFRALSFSFSLGVGRQINIASPIALVAQAANAGGELVITEAPDRGAPGFGTIAGRIVVEGTDRGLRAAVVQTGASQDVTDDDGYFLLRGLGEGPHHMVVRRVGYEPVEVEVRMEDGAQMQIETAIGLVLQAPELAELVVEGENPVPPRLREFYERIDRGFGHYITPEYIERRHPFRTTELLESTPGVVVTSGGIDERIVTMRGGSPQFGPGRGPVDRCMPAYYLDGIEVAIEDLDREIQVQDVAAMEVYNSAMLTPPQYRKPNFSCGTILIWTK